MENNGIKPIPTKKFSKENKALLNYVMGRLEGIASELNECIAIYSNQKSFNLTNRKGKPSYYYNDDGELCAKNSEIYSITENKDGQNKYLDSVCDLLNDLKNILKDNHTKKHYNKNFDFNNIDLDKYNLSELQLSVLNKAITNNTSIFHDSLKVGPIQNRKFTLNIGRKSKIIKKILKIIALNKSNTGVKGTPIPLKKAKFDKIYRNYLMDYLVYIRNIPLKTKN